MCTHTCADSHNPELPVLESRTHTWRSLWLADHTLAAGRLIPAGGPEAHRDEGADITF